MVGIAILGAGAVVSGVIYYMYRQGMISPPSASGIPIVPAVTSASVGTYEGTKTRRVNDVIMTNWGAARVVAVADDFAVSEVTSGNKSGQWLFEGAHKGGFLDNRLHSTGTVTMDLAQLHHEGKLTTQDYARISRVMGISGLAWDDELKRYIPVEEYLKKTGGSQ